MADSLILATRADATILVIRAGVTSRESLGEGVARLRQGRAHIAGALLNAVSERSRYYFYRRYGYYRHGYYHQDGDQDAPRSRVPGALSLFSRSKKQGRRSFAAFKRFTIRNGAMKNVATVLLIIMMLPLMALGDEYQDGYNAGKAAANVVSNEINTGDKINKKLSNLWMLSQSL